LFVFTKIWQPVDVSQTSHHFYYSCQILYQILNNFSRSDDPSSPLGAERRFRSVAEKELSPLNPQGHFQSEAEKESKKSGRF